MSSNSQPTPRDHYYVPHGSIYPFILSLGMFLLALGFIQNMNNYNGTPVMLLATAIILFVMSRWFATVIHENQTGAYRDWEDKSFRTGMIWFIASEVAFFAAFFGALFYVRNISVPDLLGMLDAHGVSLYDNFRDMAWPASGAGPKGNHFEAMGWKGLPLINTGLLLTSGATITWAHWGLLKDSRLHLNLGLFFTIALGVIFLGCQAYEYHHAYTEMGLTLGAGVYGSTFFMLTGFHGFHVTLGTIMLMVIFGRTMSGHFDSKRHFAFEAVAWYWHFVDVVWVLLFFLIYVV